MFDEEPDGNPHGECAAEIARLTAELKEAREDLEIHEGISVERDASLVGAQERIRNLEMDLAEKARPLDAEMARLNQNLIAANIEIDRLRTEGWPKLDKPARVGGGTFGVGVSAKLVVSAAQAAYANEAERRAMTKEQRHEAERNRREFWEMINGPLEAKR